MRHTKRRILATLAAIGLLGSVGAASATIVSGMPNADFTTGTYDLNLADGSAIYSFQNGGPGGFFGLDGAAVKTSGNALVNANAPILGGGPAPYFTGSRAPFINGSLLGNYKSFDTFTRIDTSSVPTYIALALDLTDGRHFGYAEVDGPQLVSYGYQTDPGVGIQAGATAPAGNPVPGPGSLSLLGLALALIGFGAMAGRYRRS